MQIFFIKKTLLVGHPIDRGYNTLTVSFTEGVTPPIPFITQVYTLI